MAGTGTRARAGGGGREEGLKNVSPAGVRGRKKRCKSCRMEGPHPAKVGGMVGGGVAASTGSTGAREDEGTGRVISRVVKSTHVKNNRGIAIPFTA